MPQGGKRANKKRIQANERTTKRTNKRIKEPTDERVGKKCSFFFREVHMSNVDYVSCELLWLTYANVLWLTHTYAHVYVQLVGMWMCVCVRIYITTICQASFHSNWSWTYSHPLMHTHTHTHGVKTKINTGLQIQLLGTIFGQKLWVLSIVMMMMMTTMLLLCYSMTGNGLPCELLWYIPFQIVLMCFAVRLLGEYVGWCVCLCVSVSVA